MNEVPEPISYDEMNRLFDLLDGIIDRFDLTDDEAAAIRDASVAISVVNTRRSMMRSFKEFKMSQGGELSQEQINQLRDRGINVDDLDFDTSE